MSREEAIDLLDNLKGMIDDTQGNDYDSAFSMAIADMQKLEKIEQIFEIRGFGEYPCTYEDMCREVMKIVKGGAENEKENI